MTGELVLNPRHTFAEAVCVYIQFICNINAVCAGAKFIYTGCEVAHTKYMNSGRSKIVSALADIY